MGNLILWTAAKEFTEVTNLEKGRVSDVTISNNKGTWDKAGTSIQQSVDYNGVKIDSTNGINVISSQNTLLLNASKGIELKKKSTSETIFGVDTNGNLTIKGNINMIGGSIAWDSLTGQNPAADATNTWKDVTTDSRYSGLFYTANGKLLLKADAVIIGSNTKFDDGYDPTKIELGTTNLVENGAFLNGTYNGWTLWGTPPRLWVDSQGTIKDSPKCISMDVNASNQGINQSVKVTVGRQYTMSVWAWCKTGSTLRPAIMVNNNGEYPGTIGTKDNTWEKLSFTFTAKSSNITVFLGRNGAAATGTYSFVSVQLEEGNRTTDWKPSAKDMMNDAGAAIGTAIDNVNIGGKNLLLQSNVPVTTTDYLVREYTLTENWVVGAEYTFVIKGSIPAGQIWGLWVNGSANRVAEVKTSWINGIMYVTFKCIAINTGFERVLRLYNTPQNTTSSTVEWVALYKGNKPMDWAPAPEDVTNSIDNITVGGKNLMLETELRNTTPWIFTSDGSVKMESGVMPNGANNFVTSVTGAGVYKDITQYIPVEGNTEYTFSCNAGGTFSTYLWEKKADKNPTAVYKDNAQSYSGKNWDMSSPRSDFTRTIKTQPDAKFIQFIFRVQGAATGYTSGRLALAKLERGNRASDWTPSPEDVYKVIDEVNVGGTNLLTNSGFNPPDNWSNNTAIEKYTDNTNALRLSRTNFATGNTRYQMAQTATIFNRKAASYYSLSALVYVDSSVALVGGNANSLSARFFKDSDASLQDLIVIDLSAVEKNKWVWVSGIAKLPNDVRSNVEIMLSINQNGTIKIAQPKFEEGNRPTSWTPAPDDVFNQPVGGRNLLLDSQMPNIASNNSPIYPIDVYPQTEGNVQFLRVKNSKKGSDVNTFSVFNTLPFANMTEVLSGRQVTISHKVRASKPVDMKLMALIYIQGAGTAVRFADDERVVKVTGSWSTVSTTVIMPQNMIALGYTGIRFIAYTPTATQPDLYVDYREWKVELGSKVTDWNPAPEDVQKQYDTLNTDYGNNKINWNNMQTVVNAWKGPAEGGVTTIKGGLLQTGTITANKLFLGDTTNLCENPDFENDANGAFPTGFTQTTNVRVKDISGFGTGGNGSNRALELDATNGFNNDVYSNSFIPVTPGQQFYVEAEARYLNTAGSGVGRIGFSCYSAKKVHLSNWSSAIYWNGTKLTTFTKKGAIWTVPDNCYYVYIWISFQNNGETTNKWYVDNIRINRAASGEMIVDGSITARHIQADSITGDRIQANSLTADKIRIASFENLYTNGTFELGDVNWKANSGTTYQILKDPNTSYQGNWYMRIPHDGKFNDIFDSNEVYVMPGEKYYFDGYARVLTGTASTRTFIVQWLNKDGGIITHNYPTEALNTSWKKISYVIEAPAAAVKMKVGLSVGGLNTAGQYTLFCNVFCRRQSGGELIVDGSITANQLNVGNIFGNSAVIQKIQTYDLSANRIVSGNLEVGGSQLAIGTAWAVSGLPTNKSAGLDLGLQTDSGEDYLVLAQATANELFAYLKRFPLVGGKKITVSYDYNLDSNVKGVDVFVLASKTVVSESNVWSTGFDYQYNTADTVYDERISLGSNWFRVRKTFTLANDIKSAFIRIDMNGVNNATRGNTRIRSLMVNYGNLAMDWQPHSDEDISIGGINARHIAANSITAREIQAGSITSNELSVLAKSLVNNFSMTKTLSNYATGQAACTIVADPLGTKGSVMKMSTATDSQIQSDFFEVNPSKSYRFKVAGYVPNPTATTSMYFGLYVFNENKVEIPMMKWQQSTLTLSSPASNPYFWIGNGTGLNDMKSKWVDMEGILTAVGTEIPAAIPANKNVSFTFLMPPEARYAKIRFFHHYSKTNVDSYWAHPSVTEVDSGMITFDQAQGGTLKLGTSTGNGFLQVVKQGTNSTETVGQIDETGAYFPRVQADEIIGNVVSTVPGWMAVHFDLINGNDSNSGTRQSPKRNVQAYLDSMPKYIEVGVEIYIINGTVDSLLRVRGFHGPGYINIRGNNPGSYTTVNAGIQMVGIACRATVRDFIFKAGDNYQDAGEGSMLMLDNAVEVSIDSNKFYGNNKVSKIINITHHSFGRIENCEMYDSNDRGLSVAFFGHAYIGKNCKGGRIPTAIFGAENATIQGPYNMSNATNYTRWDGAVWRYDYSYIGGYARGGDKWISDIWNIDYGEATPPPPPPPSEYVREWFSQGGQNWSANGYWDDEIYVKQGNWGYGDRTGVWWFSSDLKNTLNGKTILEAQLTITRYSKGGNSGAREARIVAHQYADGRPPNNPGVSNEYVSEWFSWGETKTVNVTSFVQQKIASGVDRGFGLKFANSQANYMAFLPQAKLWVKYK